MDTTALLEQNKKALVAIKDLKARLARAESVARAPIAVVGMACRFPGGCRTPDDLWALLREERDAVGEARWPDALFDAGAITTRALGRIDHEADFDPEFFHVSPREAASMDPQHRLLLEVAWEACENAGILPEKLQGSRTGIFVGIGNNDYGDFELRNADLNAVSAHAGTGNAACLAAGRLSFFLGTKGPALVIDTACSSSLVAIHQACASLRQGESEVALAGGINLVLSPNGSVFLTRFGALSPTGRCRAFAEAADGYVRAEGCGVVVLKRLDDAQRDGDPIWAVIRGSALNHDGRSGGLTVPNGAAQRELLLAALANAGVAPQRIGYLEAHGTGTPLGDPIEMGAIAAVFGSAPRPDALRVGSVKSNLGHTEAAAGIAGFIKAALCLRHRAIPAHLHFETPSSRIDWNMPVAVPTRLEPWTAEGPRMAGVSSFGFSGTNAHVILEEAPPREARRASRSGTQLLCLSAHHERSLVQLAAAYRDRLSEEDGVADVCHTAARRRVHHRNRLVVQGTTADDLRRALSDFLEETHHPAVVRGETVLDGMSKTAFVFSGQGSQWIGMGRELLASDPDFASGLRFMDVPFREEFGWSLVDALLAEPSQLDRTCIAQPVIVALQIALADLWRRWGVVPDAVLGHSLGELTAAYLAGVLPRTEALHLAGLRGRFMDEATGRGKMAELSCSEADARRYVEGHEDEVAIAALNGPETTVLAGATEALGRILERVASDGIKHRLLRVDYAFHSPQMRAFREPFEAALRGLNPRRAELCLYSSVTAAPVRGEDLTSGYWGRNLTDAVRFHPALVAMLRDGYRAIVEISPHPVLFASIQETLRREGVAGAAAYSLRRGVAEAPTLLANVAALHVAGYPIDWSAIYPGEADAVSLPAYPWHHRRFWPASSELASLENAPAKAPAQEPSSKLWNELQALGTLARPPRIERHVREQLARVLHLAPDAAPSKRTLLSDLGMDSVGAVELSKALRLTRGHELTPAVVFERPTIEGLTDYLAREFDRLRGVEVAVAAPEATVSVASSSEPIAIIGMGCRFPGGIDDPESFWQFLEEGANGVREAPKERWDLARYYDEEPGTPGRMYTAHGGFLTRVDGFDAEFFGISPREAQSMDPQQRIFLQTCWEALENAGIAAETLEGTRTGVYAGIVNQDYAMMQMKDTAHGEMDTYFATGHPHCVVSGRVSYQLGLRGPTLSVDTACSSSLVALHLACQSLRLGHSDLALAGGINLLLMPEIYMIRCQARMLSPSGRCATFDASADGYIPGEGSGVVVLKRLGDALRDGDRIDAVLRATHVNHDGRSNGMTVPSGSAQRELMLAALNEAGLEPHRVGYLEAHGTGTKLGDPIEMAAIQDVYCADRPAETPLLIGSVKTNFGHLESAAGICGLIKAVLALRHGAVPRNLHFTELNPHIELHAATRIPTELTPWRAAGPPRCAAVSSFGMSGTNAHAILEEAPPRAPKSQSATTDVRLVPLSAHHPEALRAHAARLKAHLEARPELSLDDVLHTLHKRTPHRQRAALRAGSLAELHEQLATVAAGEDDARCVRTDEVALGDPKVVFVFPGQGSQWIKMGCQLLEREPEFAAELQEVDTWIQTYAGWSVLAELRADAEASRLDQVDVIQPCIFAVQVGLARLWRSWGVVPSAVIGHSMGEVAAAYVAGVLSLEDAVCIITRRSQIVKRTRGNGAMALVELGREEAERALTGQPEVAVAAENGPHTVLLSGAPGPMEQVLEELRRRDVFCRAVKVDYASHSPQMDALRPVLNDALGQVRAREAKVAFYSTVTHRVEDGLAMNACYWADNLREPVLFWPVLRKLVEDGHNVFLEISPHPVLVPAMTQGLQHLEAKALTLPSLYRDKSESDCLLEARARYFCAGGRLACVSPEGAEVLALPSYPWQEQRFWYTPSAQAAGASAVGRMLERVATTADGRRIWESAMSPAMMPSLADHRVNGMVLFPGAGYVELVLEAAAELGLSGATRIDALEIRAALVLREDGARTVQVELTPLDERTFAFAIGSRDDDGAVWTRHADGLVTREAGEAVGSTEPLEALRGRLSQRVSAEDHYLRTRERGLEYGAAYQVVGSLFCRPGEVLAELQVPAAVQGELSGCQVHPSLLDGAFQVIDTALSGLDRVDEGAVYLPSALHGVRLHRKPGARIEGLHAHLKLLETAARDPATVEAQLWLRDADGAPVLSVERFVIRRVEGQSEVPSEWFYQLHWQPLEASPRPVAKRDESWLVFADAGGLAAAVADRLAPVGVKTTLIRKDTKVAFRELFEQHPPSAFTRVLYFWGLDAPSLEAEPDVLPAELPETESLLELVQALAATDPQPCPRLWVMTSGTTPRQAPLWAMARVLDYEHPEFKTVSCELDRRSVDLFVAMLCAEQVPDQMRLRAGIAHEARLTRYVPPAAPSAAPEIDLAQTLTLLRRLAPFERGRTWLVLGAEPRLHEAITREAALHDTRVLAHAEDPVDVIVNLAAPATAARMGSLLDARGTFIDFSASKAPPTLPSSATFMSLRLPRQPVAEEGQGWGDASGSYLITGGLGALGLRVASFLVDRGVRHLALLGRSAPDARAQEAIRALQARGAHVRIFAADVARRDDLQAALHVIAQGGAPLRGVVHCAGILRDGALLQMDRAKFRSVLDSKVAGAWNLHALTRNLPLQHFVLFSSVASMLGSPGQGNYAAANAFMDGLAAHRRARGLPALAIQWGAFRDIGLAANAERSGIAGIAPEKGMKALELALRGGETTLGVFPFPFLLWRKLNPQIAKNSLFATIRAESRYRDDETSRDASIAEALAAAAPRARRDHLDGFLKQNLSRVLKVPVEHVRPQLTFKEMGFDSLMAIELRNRLEAGLSVSLSSTLIWRYPTLDELATFLLERVAGHESTAAPAPSAGRWLVRERPNPSAKLRLLCFPHGGAGASAFQGWWQQFPEDVEILAFQPPGREERLQEEPERSMSAYASAIVDELEPLLDTPFAVFGYSLGGLTGFATLAELRRRTGRTPRHVFVSSCFAPHIPFAETTLSRVSTQQSALKAMAFYQSTPDSVFRDPEMQALLARSMDADNSVVESYHFGDERPLECPITAFAGRADDLAPLEEQQRWRELTTGRFDLLPFEGDHFFFLRDKRAVLTELQRRLLPLRSK
ncbi:SDR family NAD(P)-dependent oxidoreductase [Pendulispora rubella]|uniref:SDR family NAD(P)-dependent oxidoreductase n=1 Tax=Pendulispora rubella TaxID=2741070 RepID=A0ABZ2KZU9_9BACT